MHAGVEDSGFKHREKKPKLRVDYVPHGWAELKKKVNYDNINVRGWVEYRPSKGHHSLKRGDGGGWKCYRKLSNC